MSLLTLCRGLALNVGLPIPNEVLSASGREWGEAAQIANEVGQSLARRVAWGALTKTAEMTGSGTVPADFDRLAEGVCVVASGMPIRPMTRAEWTMGPGTGSPRYFLLETDKITFWPEGSASITYQSSTWTDAFTDTFTADDQSPLMDEGVFLLGLIARWRRQKGMPFEDQEAEFEAALSQVASSDDRGRL